MLVHGITDTLRTWDLVRPALERHHDVLAVTLPGHAGGPPLSDPVTATTLVDGVIAEMDRAGFADAHVVGNSLGGYIALQLAERGRARSVVALAPAGGWLGHDRAEGDTMEHFRVMNGLVQAAAPHADAIAATPEGRRRATEVITVAYEHLEPELIAHMIRGAAGCTGLMTLLAYAQAEGWPLDAERITVPVRIIWGTEDRLLGWPRAARRYQQQLPQADWVVLDGVGHSPQLDVPLEAAELILGHSNGLV